MNTREVINITVGGYANFVGTHWWNMQRASFRYALVDEDKQKSVDINHDTMFRMADNHLKECDYTPRLVVIDTKRNLGVLPESGIIFSGNSTDDVEVDKNIWSGAVELMKNSDGKNAYHKLMEDCRYLPLAGYPLNSSCFQRSIPEIFDLNDTVQTWSDFLEENFSSKSICPIKEFFADGLDITCETYSSGMEAYEIEQTKDMIENSLRQQAEECDNFQGFHVIMDGHNGFSGLAAGVVNHLDEEYHKKTVMAFPVFQNSRRLLPHGAGRREITCRLHSTLNNLSDMSSTTSLVSPLSLACNLTSFHGPYVKFPLLSYKPETEYHTSAILAAAIENVTLPYRLYERKFTMADIAQFVTVFDRKIVSTGLSFPFPLEYEMSFHDVIDNISPEYTVQPLTPFFQPGLHNSLTQFSVLRGAFQGSGLSQERKETLFDSYLKRYSYSESMAFSLLGEKCSISPSYPRIFLEEAFSKGIITQDESAARGVTSFPVCSILSSNDKTVELLNSLIKEAERITFDGFSEALKSDFNRDDFHEVLNNLAALKENYI